MALNEPTLARLRKIAAAVKAGDTVSEMNLTWAQKNALHDETAAADLKSAGKYIEAKEQEDTTEV
tara:strand:+ start:481 stop:675 length:195 start_codon:yes stop_codon:yes gene_type:complete